MAAVKVGVLFMWTSLFQGDTSDLILSLEENGGKRQRKCGFPGLPGGSGGCVLIRRLTLRQQLVKHAVNSFQQKPLSWRWEVFACFLLSLCRTLGHR